MNKNNYFFRIALLFNLVVVAVFFFLNLPVTFINRVQEHWYLGIPFERLKNGSFWVDRSDPFPENGPHLIYLLTKGLQLTNSLLTVRLLQLPWILLSLALLWILLNQLTGFSKRDPKEIFGTAAIGLFLWISIPLGLVYPMETNGMTSGFACVVLALILLKKHPAAAMLALGFAYAAKAQFISFFPCVIAYRLMLDYSGKNFGRHLLLVTRDALLLFVPAAIILPPFFWLFGWFQTTADLKAYAWEGPSLLLQQFGSLFQRYASGAKADPLANSARLDTLHTELASYSKLVYMHIIFSVSLCVSGLAWAAWARLPSWWNGKARANGPPTEIALLSVFGCASWIIYFFVNLYPYCYNMLPILPFNFLIVPYVMWELRKRFATSPSRERLANQVTNAAYLLAAAFMVFLVFRYTRYYVTLPKGDALEPYYWMQGKPWTSSR